MRHHMDCCAEGTGLAKNAPWQGLSASSCSPDMSYAHRRHRCTLRAPLRRHTAPKDGKNTTVINDSATATRYPEAAPEAAHTQPPQTRRPAAPQAPQGAAAASAVAGAGPQAAAPAAPLGQWPQGSLPPLKGAGTKSGPYKGFASKAWLEVRAGAGWGWGVGQGSGRQQG